MSKYSKDGVSVLSVLDARKVKKSGLFPVKIQVALKSLFCWNTKKVQFTMTGNCIFLIFADRETNSKK
ncbi:hypothetical protein BUN20_07640 [Bacteroides fragilis]|nr:hypothetical protein BUN20_07640 [Bacteroides fragilis]OCL18256.1 hypothetical protein AOQ65_09490 [Bacteroides fragilis]OCM96277.1 hypothetical protein AE749_18135 [Bacteroides fragilis]